jgi:alpha-galactosidase
MTTSAYATTLSRFELGDMAVEYVLAVESQAVGLRVFPASMSEQVAIRREFLETHEIERLPEFMRPVRAWRVEPLVQVKLAGDAVDGFSQGVTMRNSETLASLRHAGQETTRSADGLEVVTTLRSARGYACEHRLRYQEAELAFTVDTTFVNEGDRPLSLELLASFALSGLTPFAADDAPGRLYLHRFRSMWSAEARHVCDSLEALNLERSWSGHGVRAERFGQIGTMPVRGWFPFLAVEDRPAGVFWGAQLAWAGSWQMEAYRRDDQVTLSGGLADRELGHWTRLVAPGESVTSPPAFVTTAAGDLDDLCQRLTAIQRPAAERGPAVEASLPVVFNEFCTTWGSPTHERMVGLARRLRGSGVRYLVIDAGWYESEGASWELSQGEWSASERLFPQGIAATAAAIREEGLIPGLWFELEVVGEESPHFRLSEHLLLRDGRPVTAGHRHFWDFRDPWVREYLRERVVGLVRDAGFGYIKVDYNETVGIGVDGAESLGQGLLQHVLAVQDFFRELRASLPELVVELCASGGHRLEPSMLALASMGSFSDAHEAPEIPIIAASLHRLMLPRQSQIWAVLHPEDSLRRLGYSLAAGFLGRLCLSGAIDELDDEQWALVREAIAFYELAAPVIKDGRSAVHARIGPSWRHPRGAQAVVRVADAGDRALVVVHAFATPPPEFTVPLPAGEWQVAGTFAPSAPAFDLSASTLRVEMEHDYEGSVLLLAR